MTSKHPTRSRGHALRTGLAMLLLQTAAVSAWSMQSGQTAQGHAFESGGVSQEEIVELRQRRNAYSLWVVTAELRSGAYLADVQVTIRNEQGQSVFDAALDGPWLFINLPLGRYSVQASYLGRTQERTTTIHRGDRHQLFFRFATGDTVGEDK
jgi:hypothetical protein